MLISRNLNKESHEVSIKTRSTPASLSFKGQATKHASVKWSLLKRLKKNNLFLSTYRQEPSDSGIPDSAAGSQSSGDSCSVPDDDSEDFSYSVSNPPTPKLPRGKITSDTDSENTFVTGTQSPSSSSTPTNTSHEKQNSMFLNSTEAVMGKYFSGCERFTFWCLVNGGVRNENLIILQQIR